MTALRTPARSRLEDAYALFRLERQGNNVSPSTLRHYDFHVPRFFGWLHESFPDAVDVADVTVDHLRFYRAAEAQRVNRFGRPISAETLFGSHRTIRAFFRWADLEGYDLDHRILRLKKVRVPEKEPDLYTLSQLRAILAACNPAFPQEEVAVRLLVGSGVRASELCGLSTAGPDGLPDLLVDSMGQGRAELRVRWDAGAKGRKTRRVPIPARLATTVKRYEVRDRPRTATQALLVNRYGRPFTRWGLDSMLRRLERRCGFRVHAHAFRHTFATVATQMGWNFERLRAAMGHSDYQVLQRYVRLATERELGPLKDWGEFILRPSEL